MRNEIFTEKIGDTFGEATVFFLQIPGRRFPCRLLKAFFVSSFILAQESVSLKRDVRLFSSSRPHIPFFMEPQKRLRKDLRQSKSFRFRQSDVPVKRGDGEKGVLVGKRKKRKRRRISAHGMKGGYRSWMRQ